MSTEVSRLIGRFATEALIAEATLAPKPGLVTPFSQGAHSDMDFRMFVASSKALRPCFEACARAGSEAAASCASTHHLLTALRPIGCAGETAMGQATGGVNTHKGAIFCLGLLSAALGFMHEQGSIDLDSAFEFVSGLCAGLVDQELGRAKGNPRTAGARLYREQGVRGARGQAEDGYPLLRNVLLPFLREAYPGGRQRFALACLDALLLSMRELEDSCLLARGGRPGLVLAQEGAEDVLRLGGAGSAQGMRALRDLDRRLCEAGLSPGGSADLVAAGIFLVRAERHLYTIEVGRLRIA